MTFSLYVDEVVRKMRWRNFSATANFFLQPLLIATLRSLSHLVADIGPVYPSGTHWCQAVNGQWATGFKLIVSPAVAGCVPFASPSTKKGASKNAQKPRVMHLLKNGWKVVRLCFFSSQKIRLQFRLNNFRDNTDDGHTGSRSIQSTCRFAQH